MCHTFFFCFQNVCVIAVGYLSHTYLSQEMENYLEIIDSGILISSFSMLGNGPIFFLAGQLR